MTARAPILFQQALTERERVESADREESVPESENGHRHLSDSLNVELETRAAESSRSLPTCIRMVPHIPNTRTALPPGWACVAAVPTPRQSLLSTLSSQHGSQESQPLDCWGQAAVNLVACLQ